MGANTHSYNSGELSAIDHTIKWATLSSNRIIISNSNSNDTDNTLGNFDSVLFMCDNEYSSIISKKISIWLRIKSILSVCLQVDTFKTGFY